MLTVRGDSRPWSAGRWSMVWLMVIATPVAAQDDGPGRAGERVRTIDHAIEFYISDDAMQAQYVRTLDLAEVGPTEVRGGFFYNEDRDLIAVADLLTSIGDDVDVRRLEVKVGTRVYGAFLAPEDEDVFGVGLGGEAEYFFNRSRTTSIKLSLFYSPDIATFGHADNIQDASVRLMTRLRGGTDIFVGVRAFEIDLPIDREVDDNLHVGFRRSF
jgi:hypothetical protein